mgnify:CR=1 FL=1
MIGIDLLPKELKARSVSQREIVLAYDDALKALDIIIQSDWAFLGWEAWLKYPDGKVGHIEDYQGTVSIEQEKDETWNDYKKRGYDFVKKTIIQDQLKWEKDPRSNDHQLFFCITPISSKA